MSIERLREILKIESEAVALAWINMVPDYDDCLYRMTYLTPLFTGMGKSGYIAQKAASTFRSLGVPAHYIHPGDASHGDMGAITGDCIPVMLSNSGNTPELADMIHFCRDRNKEFIAITGNADSPLAKAADYVLCYGPVEEACSMGLAPTTSTTVALAICDALAIQVSEKRGVTPAIFHQHHPGGKLGQQLRTAADVASGPVPVVRGTESLAAAALAMTGSVAGICLVVGGEGVTVGTLRGVITDGDLRRTIAEGVRTFTDPASSIAQADPITICETAPVRSVQEVMDEHRITKLLVENSSGAITGVINLHDL